MSWSQETWPRVPLRLFHLQPCHKAALQCSLSEAAGRGPHALMKFQILNDRSVCSALSLRALFNFKNFISPWQLKSRFVFFPASLHFIPLRTSCPFLSPSACLAPSSCLHRGPLLPVTSPAWLRARFYSAVRRAVDVQLCPDALRALPPSRSLSCIL